MSKLAYAVSVDGAVLPSTVFSHARGAMANYLAQRGWAVGNSASDEQIRAAFQQEVEGHAPAPVVELVVVALTVARVADPATVPLVQHPGLPGGQKAPKPH